MFVLIEDAMRTMLVLVQVRLATDVRAINMRAKPQPGLF